MENTKTIRLTGDIKAQIGEGQEERAQNFMIDLELLMMRYKINKVDVAWERF